MEAIGVIHSCFEEKFAIPRQPGLVKEAKATLEFYPPYDEPAACEGLSDCSHIWVTFLFHKNLQQGWKPRVRPPRLGGNEKTGVFATRSSFRPNGIGLSVVKLDQVLVADGKTRLLISGVDLLDGTPVLDIKPYLPYADVVEGATHPWAMESPDSPLEVIFSEQSKDDMGNLVSSDEGRDSMLRMIEALIALDPRPAYQNRADKVYGFRVSGLEVKFQVAENVAKVVGISKSP